MSVTLKTYHRRRSVRGFSILEVLTVAGIFMLLATFATLGFSSIARSYSLSSAAQNLASLVQLARQTASTKNIPVEVRIYQVPDFGSNSGSSTHWRVAAIFEGSAGQSRPLDKPLVFPARVVVSEDENASPLFKKMDEGSSQIIGFGATLRPYRAFTVRPNGTIVIEKSNELQGHEWFLSLHQDNEKREAANSLPSNYAAVQVNPVTARAKVWRP